MAHAARTPFAYVSAQFLQMIRYRLWRVMLLAFDKIVLPAPDLVALTTLTDAEAAWLKHIADLHHGRVPSQASAEPSPAVPQYIATGALGTVCAGDKQALAALRPHLLSWHDCGLPEIQSLAELERVTGGHAVLHPELFEYIEQQLPPYSRNNLPWETLVSLRDVLLAAHLNRVGAGTAFLDRHDWNVIAALAGVHFPLSSATRLAPWVTELGCTDTDELAHCILNTANVRTAELVDTAVIMEVPSFDDIPVAEVLRYKSRDRFKAVVTRIQELQARHGSVDRQLVADTFHASLQEAFDHLRPSGSGLFVALAGAAPIPIVNPFSLWSIGQEVRNMVKARREFDALIVLSDLRRLASRPHS